MLAAAFGHLAVAETLLDQQADIHLLDKDGLNEDALWHVRGNTELVTNICAACCAPKPPGYASRRPPTSSHSSPDRNLQTRIHCDTGT